MTTRRKGYDFSEKTKKLLAKRAGHQCSNPNCNAPTSSTISVGVAAHIHAASPGGPRYNPDLTPEQCSHISNGIHLCENCGAIIDKENQKDYPPELLQHIGKLNAKAMLYRL